MAATIAATSFAGAAAAVSSKARKVQAFDGLRSAPFAKPSPGFAARTSSNGGRVQCMKVWNPVSNIKYETLSYLPPLTQTQIARQVDYLLENGWVPCLEFDANNNGAIYREYVPLQPGYYDGRYWTMWKLPMFGCKNSAMVINEVEECKKTFPQAYIRVIGFDNLRQVQCISFIVHKP